MTWNRRAFLTLAAAFGATVGARPGLAQPAVSSLSLVQPDGRTTKYRVMTPERGGRWGVVLFSHGANSSNASYDRLWQAWADRGYMVIGPNHPDTGPPATQVKMTHGDLWRARIADTKLPLTQRAAFDTIAKAHDATLNWDAVCGAGHSFGAVVAQALAGALLTVPTEGTPTDARDPAIAACLCLSPPGPLKDFIPEDAWSTVTIPSLIQTGDADILPGFVDDWRSRLSGFSGAPDRWTIVARGVNHYFHGLICTLVPGAVADLPALTETAKLTGEFLDAYIGGDATAKQGLALRAERGDDGVLTFAAA